MRASPDLPHACRVRPPGPRASRALASDTPQGGGLQEPQEARGAPAKPGLRLNSADPADSSLSSTARRPLAVGISVSPSCSFHGCKTEMMVLSLEVWGMERNARLHLLSRGLGVNQGLGLCPRGGASLRNPAWQGAWRGWGLDERGTPIHHDDTDRCCLHHAAWRAGLTQRQSAEAPRASGALPEPPLLWGFIQNPQHSITCTRAGPGPREPTQGPPGLMDLGMVTPGVPVCLSPRIHPKKGHSTQMGPLERLPASWTLGEAAAPAQSPFRCRSGEAGSGKRLGSLAHLKGMETGPASMLNTEKRGRLISDKRTAAAPTGDPGMLAAAQL